MQPIAPPLAAVIGSDDSDKSMVCEHLITAVEEYGAAGRVHLREQAENVGRLATKLPLIGKSLHKTIERNQVKTAKRLPGPTPALVITAFVVRRLLRFRHTLACRRRGLIVLTDCYPQGQIPSAYDDTVFPPNVEDGRFVSWLTSQERKAFHWVANYKPDLAIKLNVDLEVVCVRRPSHERELLARRIAATPQLTFGDAQLIDIDASQPLEKVLVDIEKTITDFMTTRSYHQWKMKMLDRQDRAFPGRLNQLQCYPVQPTRKKNRHR